MDYTQWFSSYQLFGFILSYPLPHRCNLLPMSLLWTNDVDPIIPGIMFAVVRKKAYTLLHE